MSEFRLSAEADGELDDKWLRLALGAASISPAAFLITLRTVSGYWRGIHIWGERAITIWGRVYGAFRRAITLIVYRIEAGDVVLIARFSWAAATSPLFSATDAEERRM